MAAMTPNERLINFRKRQKLKEEERLKLVLAKRIRLDIYHATNDQLEKIMSETDIDEIQDIVTRLIHGYGSLTAKQKEKIFK